MIEIIFAVINDLEGRRDYIIADITEIPAGGMKDLKKTFSHFMSTLGSRASGTVTFEHEFEQTVLMKPNELFVGFYKEMTGDDLTEYQVGIFRDCIYSGDEEK